MYSKYILTLFSYILVSICTYFHLLLLLEFIYCSCLCCLTALIAMPNNDNTLI